MVTKPVVNLRRERQEHEGQYVEDPLQETQLLLGDTLLGGVAEEGWVKVHAPNQPFETESGEWTGYPGWVRESDVEASSYAQDDTLIVVEQGSLVRVDGEEIAVSAGTYLEMVEEREQGYLVQLPGGEIGEIEKGRCREVEVKLANPREFIVEKAEGFLDMPYLWGGRSSYMPDDYDLTGVDCSGLTSLLYAMAGKIIPRNAHDQYERSLKIDYEDLEAGDLIFLARPDKPERMVHVMLYEGDGIVIEATTEVGKVRRVEAREKIGTGLERVGEDGKAPKWYVFFGSFLKG